MNSLEVFVRAAPQPQRASLRIVLELWRRPRSRALLSRSPAIAQLAGSLEAIRRYEDPDVAKPLGWDADAVVRRGRELRRSEGRP